VLTVLGVADVTDRLLTAREVADRFGFKSPETILRWTRQGKLPAYKLPNGAIRYRENDLEARLEEWATTERGVVTHPEGRRPSGTLTSVTHPINEED
jgi:predicted DNA-binding transcriptional regulator AlpA